MQIDLLRNLACTALTSFLSKLSLRMTLRCRRRLSLQILPFVSGTTTGLFRFLFLVLVALLNLFSEAKEMKSLSCPSSRNKRYNIQRQRHSAPAWCRLLRSLMIAPGEIVIFSASFSEPLDFHIIPEEHKMVWAWNEVQRRTFKPFIMKKRRTTTCCSHFPSTPHPERNNPPSLSGNQI